MFGGYRFLEFGLLPLQLSRSRREGYFSIGRGGLPLLLGFGLLPKLCKAQARVVIIIVWATTQNTP